MVTRRIRFVAKIGVRIASVVLIGCAACARSPVDAAGDPAESVLAGVDRIWDVRGGLGLAAVDVALDRAAAGHAQHPGILWRRARLATARGLASNDPVRAVHHFADARAVAIACLDQEPEFRQARRQSRWTDAVAHIEPERVPCLVQAAVAWTRWFAEFGQAASVDSVALGAMLDRLDQEKADDIEDATRWTRALLAIAVGDRGRTVQQALWSTVQRGLARNLDDSWVRWSDLHAINTNAASEARPDRDPKTPEERAARTRALGRP